MSYSVYDFFTADEIERSWLISILSDYGFEGFEELTPSLKGFVLSEKISKLNVHEILFDNDLKHIWFTCSQLEDKNWNEEWEKNFKPVEIANRVVIRAPFHKPATAEFELIIEPKMSFGTGHHATTALMIEQMLNLNCENKSVLDFGSGTGVLAILAEKLKAKKILAIDNEHWAFENCGENVERNNCNKIQCILGDDTYSFNEKFGIILANINRNVILNNISAWKKLLNENSLLLVSGILVNDEKDILNCAAENNLHSKKILRKDGWVAILFSAQN